MRKAKLDILENIPDLDISARPAPSEDEPQEGDAPHQWAINKLVLIAMPAVLVLAVMVVVIVYLLTPAPKPDTESFSSQEVDHPSATLPTDAFPIEDSVGPSKAATGATPGNIVHIRDFIIDLQNSAGKGQVLLCDIALDLEDGTDIHEMGDLTDIRQVVYWTAQNRNAVALRSVAERRRLKDDLTRELQKLPGGKIIRNVYFTNYLIM